MSKDGFERISVKVPKKFVDTLDKLDENYIERVKDEML